MQLSAVYILTNKNHTILYTGVTSNLVRRFTSIKQNFIKALRLGIIVINWYISKNFQVL